MWTNFNFKWFWSFSNYIVVFGVKIFMTTFLFIFFWGGGGEGRSYFVVYLITKLLLVTTILFFLFNIFYSVIFLNFCVGFKTQIKVSFVNLLMLDALKIFIEVWCGSKGPTWKNAITFGSSFRPSRKCQDFITTWSKHFGRKQRILVR